MITGKIVLGAVALGVIPLVAYRKFSSSPANELLSSQNNSIRSAFPSYLFGNSLTLLSSEYLSHDTKLLRFKLPNMCNSGIKPGKAVLVSIVNQLDKKRKLRPYSPIYDPEEPNILKLAIKNENERGASGALHNLNVGSSITVRGPLPIHNIKFETLADKVNLIAGGSGITPVFSVLKFILLEKPKTNVVLVYANKSPDDIIFKEELEKLSSKYSEKFQLIHVLSDPKGIKGKNVYSGRIGENILKEHLFKEGDTFICGPDGLVNSLNGSKATKGLISNIVLKKPFVF